MTTSILMIRHAIAADISSGSDADRPLTNQGRQQFRDIAAFLVQRGVVPDLILHSPLVRAVETANILRAAAKISEQETQAVEWLGFGTGLDELLSFVGRNVAEIVAVVGHEPRMSNDTAHMLGGGRMTFQPGSVACVDFDGTVRPGLGRLRFFLNSSLFPL